MLSVAHSQPIARDMPGSPSARDRARRPAARHRLAFVALVIASVATGWLASLAWALACYIRFQWTVPYPLGGRLLAWVGALLPRRATPVDQYPRLGTFEWYAWGPGAYWPADRPPPTDLLEILGYAAQEVWIGPPFELSHREWTHVPVWWLIGLWIVASVMAARAVWDRFGPVARHDAFNGRLFCSGSFELRVGLSACLSALPMMALWRFERALWEGAVLYSPSGFQWSAIEISHGAHLLLLAQVILLHWLIVWAVYRRRLRREIRLGRATPKPGVTRCLACGYERGDAERCPECGATREHAGRARPPATLRCFEWTGWKRRLLSTPAMIALMVVLFFSPAWLPLVT